MSAEETADWKARRETADAVLAEADFRDFLVAASDWFWKTNADLRVTYLSPSFFEQTGISSEQPLGRRIDAMLGPAADTDSGRMMLGALKDRQPFRHVIRPFPAPGGRVLYVRISGVPVFAPEGAFLGYRGSGCDATAECEARLVAERAQAALERRETELSAILQHIADCVVTIDTDGIIESCNLATLSAFGYREDEVIGRNVSMLIAEPDRSRHDYYIRRYVETGEGRIINVGPREATAVRKNGSTFPIELAIGEMSLEGRKVFIGTIRDLSLRARIAEELASSQQELADAQRIARLGSWSLDLKTLQAHWSEEMYRRMGLDPAKHKPSAELGFGTTHPDDRATVRKNLESIITGPNRVASFDYRIVPGDGTERIVHAEFRVITDRDGNPIRVAGTAQDVTEARRLAARLAVSEQSLARAQRISRIGSWEFDVPTGEMEWSRQLYVLFGLDPAEHKPSLDLFYSLVHPDEIEPMKEVAARLWSGELRRSLYEWRMITPTGGHRHVHSEVEVEVDESDRVVRLIGTVQDVTEIKSVEIALQEALAAANEASRSKSEFLANMSHELRTPLNAIIGFSELLMMHLARQRGGEKLIDYLRDIHNSGHHLLGIVNDVLDMSRAEANRFVLNEEAFLLSETLDWVVRLVDEVAKQQQVIIKLAVDGALPVMMGEERLIRQALLNLVSNAVKFTPPGGDVAIHACALDQGDIVIAISDSGVGMRQEDIPIALTPFGQIDPALTRKFGGAGLGLPLAKKFIELHQGALTIKSIPEKGTTVTVKLPAARRRAAS